MNIQVGQMRGQASELCKVYRVEVRVQGLELSVLVLGYGRLASGGFESEDLVPKT